MTSAARTSISAFPRGHELPEAILTLTPSAVRSYLDAVGDRNDYGESAPPLCAIALALNLLQEHIALPEGSLHTGQEVEQMAAAPIRQPLRLTGRIAQRSERQGFVISVIEFELSAGDTPLMRARSTIMAPAGVTA